MCEGNKTGHWKMRLEDVFLPKYTADGTWLSELFLAHVQNMPVRLNTWCGVVDDIYVWHIWHIYNHQHLRDDCLLLRQEDVCLLTSCVASLYWLLASVNSVFRWLNSPRYVPICDTNTQVNHRQASHVELHFNRLVMQKWKDCNPSEKIATQVKRL